MMKIAIVGSNGFAQFIAFYIESTTPYQFMILSRSDNRDLVAKGWQVVQVGYRTEHDKANLTYLLTGVDVVISTISGTEEATLVDAAADAQVGRFVPSEFNGLPHLRHPDDPNNVGRESTLERLRKYDGLKRLRYTIISCGLFFERFAPGGLSSVHINTRKSLGGEGSFMIDMRNAQATIPILDEVIFVSMISARDAARSIVAALSLPEWPQEFTFRTEHISLVELVGVCAKVKGEPFQLLTYDVNMLAAAMNQAKAIGDQAQVNQYAQMLTVAQGGYTMSQTTLDTALESCERFEEWLVKAWPPNPAV